jgi:hypothetical protein
VKACRVLMSIGEAHVFLWGMYHMKYGHLSYILTGISLGLHSEEA